ncbi:hypothetical protein IFVP182_C2120192 [Vibrio parahaemolyticus]
MRVDLKPNFNLRMNIKATQQEIGECKRYWVQVGKLAVS